MPKNARDTREQILKAAYALFRRKGFTRVSMDEIAASAKITKKTLYYHFRSKDSLFAAMFEEHHDLALAAFKTFGDKLKGNPAQIIDALFDDLAEWSSKPKWAGSGFTRIAMELADLPGHPARAIAKRHKAILEECLGDLLVKTKVPAARDRAREIWLLSEGAISLILISGDRKYAAAAAQAAKRLIALR
jgi:AcrR family transcriptional regulator